MFDDFESILGPTDEFTYCVVDELVDEETRGELFR